MYLNVAVLFISECPLHRLKQENLFQELILTFFGFYVFETMYTCCIHTCYLAAHTRKMVPITGRASSVLLKVYVRTLVKNKIERRKRRRQNKNRPINLPQGNNIVHILRVHYLTLNFNKYISTIYLYTYIL